MPGGRVGGLARRSSSGIIDYPNFNYAGAQLQTDGKRAVSCATARNSAVGSDCNAAMLSYFSPRFGWARLATSRS